LYGREIARSVEAAIPPCESFVRDTDITTAKDNVGRAIETSSRVSYPWTTDAAATARNSAAR
jgi:hypothetical protein